MAAANMMGGEESYCTVPWFWSDQYASKLQAVGFSSDGTESICRGDKASHQFAVFYLNENRLVAVEAVNSPRRSWPENDSMDRSSTPNCWQILMLISGPW